MEQNIRILCYKIDKIKKKGWLLVPRKGSGEIGLLFEKELGIATNDLPVADFRGIEIKVQNRSSNYPITLFCCTCDGPNLFEIRRIVQKYGITDAKYINSKYLYITLSCTKYSSWGRYLMMKLYIDYKRSRLYILISHSNGKVIEKKAFWEFSTIEEILHRKLNHLCFVVAESKFELNHRYARFCEAEYLKLKDNFKIFLSLLERGKITININCSVYKKGTREGKSYDHGTSFKIEKDAIFELYEHLYLDKKNSTF